MNKVLVGSVFGAVLGVLDGLTAWFTPAVRPELEGIVLGSTINVLGSTIKGIIAGVTIGLFARKVHLLAGGVLFGLGVGLFLAFGIARLQHG